MADFHGYPGQGDNRPNTNSYMTWRISMATQDRETTVQIPMAKYNMANFNGNPEQGNNRPNTNSYNMAEN